MTTGLYFSGDGARRDGDGHYQITGRVDDVINVKGHRIGTAELESCLVCVHIHMCCHANRFQSSLAPNFMPSNSRRFHVSLILSSCGALRTSGNQECIN